MIFWEVNDYINAHAETVFWSLYSKHAKSAQDLFSMGMDEEVLNAHEDDEIERLDEALGI